MKLADYLRVIIFPYLILLIIDVIDYVGTIYFSYRKTIPPAYLDIIFFAASLPVYIYVVFKVVARENGDREDATIAVFLLTFTKFFMTWVITFLVFHFVLADGSKMPQTAFTTLENPYVKFLSLSTVEQFAYHVVGSVIGGFALGVLFEELAGRTKTDENGYIQQEEEHSVSELDEADDAI